MVNRYLIRLHLEVTVVLKYMKGTTLLSTKLGLSQLAKHGHSLIVFGLHGL